MTDPFVGLRTTRATLVEMLLAGVKQDGTSTTWFDYWKDSDRRQDFSKLLGGFNVQMRHQQDGDARDNERNNVHSCHSLIIEMHPDVEDVLCFADNTFSRVIRMIDQLNNTPITELDLHVQDLQLASTFNELHTWYGIAVNTLLVIAESEEPIVVEEELIESIAMFAQQIALECYHIAREGERLRQQAQRRLGPTTEHGCAAVESMPDDDLADVERMIRIEESRAAAADVT